MAKEASRKEDLKSNFDNVEFLESSLEDPLNVLRAKLKDLSTLPKRTAIRRVLVITEVISEEGRGIDVVWSEQPDEEPWIVQDSVVSLLTRVSYAVGSGGDHDS